jgi:hypothetical protein
MEPVATGVSDIRSSQLDQFLIGILLQISQDCCSLGLRRAHRESLDHFPDRGDLRSILREVVSAVTVIEKRLSRHTTSRSGISRYKGMASMLVSSLMLALETPAWR